jgi:hypothetical protein
MTWYSTKVERLNDLAPELNRLVTAGHTIISVVNHDGKLVILSTM